MQAYESDKLLLMLSGGVDSMVLAFFLLRLKDALGLKLTCFHLNHQYRGEEADKDAAFVRDFCEQHGLDCVIESRDVPKIAKERKLGFEHCAREIRLELAEEVRRQKACDFILTAHHLDDSVEGMVHNFIRGSSVQGLSGMSFQNGRFLRPFLAISKSEILELAEHFEIPYRQDWSNFDPDFTRNLIRHTLIPQIEKLNPNFKYTLKRASEQFREDRDYLQNQAKMSLERIRLHEDASRFFHSEILCLDLSAFRALDPAIKKRVLRLIIEEQKGDLIDVYSSIIEELLLLSENDKSGKHILFKGIVFEVGRGRLFVGPAFQHADEVHTLTLGEQVFGGARFRASRIDFEGAKRAAGERNGSATRILLPEAYFKRGLQLRYRRSGDRIRPERLKGRSKSVKKLFIDQKLAGLEKERRILLALGEEVLWIPGFESSYTQALYRLYENENFVVIELLSL